MNMQIREIIVYSRHGKRSVISLKTSALNIITGTNNTGKSALIYIVSYCMGGGECLIPPGRILQAASWFGVLLQCGGERVFVARQNPYPADITNRAYIQRGAEIESPEVAPSSPNTTSEQNEDVLTRLVGISPNLHVPPIGQTRRPLAANIRHALFYCFQHQTEIETNQVLFHRQHNEFVSRDIRDTLPYFLGAVREDHIPLIEKLRLLKRELRLLEQRAAEFEAIQGTGLSNANPLIEEARQAGLIPADAQISSLPEARELLRQTEEWTPNAIPFSGSDDLISRLQSEIDGLELARRAKSEQLETAKAFQKVTAGYSDEVSIQAARLESIGLFPSDTEHTRLNCPICNQQIQQELPNSEQIRASLDELVGNLQEVAREQPHIHEYVAKLESDLSEIATQKRSKQDTLDDLFRQEDNARLIRDANVRRGMIVGRISLWLQSVPPAKPDEGLPSAIKSKQAEIGELEKIVSQDEEDERLESLLNRVNSRISKLAKELKLEFSEHPIRLDLNQATLIIDHPERRIRFKTMGAGRNWVGYHLATYLALHWHFCTQKRPVPGFLILDQPTQAFFPADRDSDMQGKEEALSTDDDRIRVRAMFELLNKTVSELNGGLQILVTDHADIHVEWFQNAIVKRWRAKDAALIPPDWPNYSDIASE